MKSYYQVLEVEPSASFAELKTAYRNKALEFHPDRGGSHEAMVRINEAWEVLSVAELRKEYDQFLKNGQASEGRFDEARGRAKHYPETWAKFDNWLGSVGRDFTDAKYGSTEFLGMGVPTGGNSFSGWLFIIAGGLLGLALGSFLCASLQEFIYPQPEVSSGNSIPSLHWQSKPKANPGFQRVLFFLTIGSGIGGAWLGRLLHGSVGSSLGHWLSQIASSNSQRDSVQDQPSSDEPADSSAPRSAKRHVSCPKCQQRLKLPSVLQNISVTCPKCGNQFEFPSSSKKSQQKESMKFPPSKQTISSILKGLLIADIALMVIAFPFGVFESMMIDNMLSEIGVSQELTDPQMFTFAIGVMFLVVLLPMLILSWVGLFKQKNWARWLYLGLISAAYLVDIPLGCFDFQFYWGLGLAIRDFGGLITGVILAILFLSPLASEFQSWQKVSPPSA